MERVVGIEPTSSAWKAEVLPLNYTRLVMTLMTQTRSARNLPAFRVLSPSAVEGVGFEPTKA